MDAYKTAGADMRLLSQLLTKTIVDAGRVVKNEDLGDLMAASSLVDVVRSHAEENMFQDFPWMPREYINVFYGATDQLPMNAVDEEMLERARQAAYGLFECSGKKH